MSGSTRGVQSIEVGVKLLEILASRHEPMMLRDIASAADVTSAKAHAYLASYRKNHFVEQDEKTGRYRLGPFALQLGIARLRIVDPPKIAIDICREFAHEVGFTIAVSVWGSYGPTVIYVHEGGNQIHIGIRPGSVFSLTGSATGRLFLHHLARKVTLATFEEQRSEGYPGRYSGELPDIRAVDDELELIAKHGFSATNSYPQPGVSAIAAPVFDATGQMVLAITLIGAAAAVDIRPSSKQVTRMIETARQISSKLGVSLETTAIVDSVNSPAPMTTAAN